MLRFVLAGLIAGVAALAADAPSSPASVTFHKDVLPILQKSCQGCHRPGQIAPMSFLTYQDTRPWDLGRRAGLPGSERRGRRARRPGYRGLALTNAATGPIQDRRRSEYSLTCQVNADARTVTLST